MKLIWKFNLVLAGIFLIAYAAAALVAYGVLQANAREEVLRTGRLMMESASASRDYTTARIKPRLETQLKYVFL
ncbi:MAG: signal protein, partial [Casimicrobiaceae bacterium]